MRDAVIEAAAAMAIRGGSDQFPGSRRLRDHVGIDEKRAIPQNRKLLARELSSRAYGATKLRDLINSVEDAAIADLVDAQAAGNRSLERERVAEIAILLAHRGETDAALEWLSRAGQLADELGDTGAHAAVLGDSGLIKALAARYDEAVQDLSDARDVYATSGDLYGVAKVDAHLGMIELSRGRLDEARTRLESALKATQADHLEDRASLEIAMAEVEIAAGHVKDAQKYLDDARPRALAADSKELLARISFEEGHLHHLGGNFRDATSSCLEAARNYWQSAHWAMYAQALGNAGIAAAHAGNLAAGEGLLRSSLQCLADLADPIGVAQAQLNLGVILLEQQQLTEAHRRISYAVAEFGRLGGALGFARASEASARVGARARLDFAIEALKRHRAVVKHAADHDTLGQEISTLQQLRAKI